MKKVVTLCLIVCAISSIWGCGSSKNFEDTSNHDYYQIGEKSSSDLTEIVLESVEYSKTKPKYLEDPLRGDISPDEGEFIKVTYSVKNIGKNELGFFSCADNHTSSQQLLDMPYVDYNDGYIFKVNEFKAGGVIQLDHSCAYQKDEKYNTSDLGSLDDPVEIEVYILVPSEVINNKDNQLLIGFTVPSSSSTEKLVYKIR